MDYLFLVMALLAGVHAYTFAAWLRQRKNKVGAKGVYFLILVGIALPVYRIVTKLYQ